MINTTSYSGRKAGYLVNEYVVDTAADVAQLPTDCSMGSRAKVISTGDEYILNSLKQWIKQPASGSSSGGSSTPPVEDESGIVIIGTGQSTSGEGDIQILADDDILIL